MNLGNNDIDARVRILVGSYLKGVKVREEDEPVIQAGMELAINFLQNINDIAYCAVNAYDRANR
jgi:hypothetical protein